MTIVWMDEATNEDVMTKIIGGKTVSWLRTWDGFEIKTHITLLPKRLPHEKRNR